MIQIIVVLKKMVHIIQIQIGVSNGNTNIFETCESGGARKTKANRGVNVSARYSI